MDVKKEESGMDVKTEAPGLDKDALLKGLNEAQLKAVTFPPGTPAQILAGPGSGKTRVLTSRVAYLVRHLGYRPMDITCVTFTNKAAIEMRRRLEKLLGRKDADNLVLADYRGVGTFHSTCVKYLRKYGQLIGLPKNFSITDADDCQKMVAASIKAKLEVMPKGKPLKEREVLSEISKAKARGESPDDMAERANTIEDEGVMSMVAHLYAEYEANLRDANSLDFDDLLVYGLKLFIAVPQLLATCRHILVDEFQDTNTTQYELMKCFAKEHNGVSVVGDPDQSIYGWRAAEIENLNKMTNDFPGTEAIYLEQNYRSTGSILSASHSVVSQDPKRIAKNLYSNHFKSTPVTLKAFATPVMEASFISTEIKRLIAYSGETLNFGDFAILLRYNALSRVLESALQKDSIPNRVVGGNKFFERMEIKDLLAYLQLAENPYFTPAFMRVINVPKRAIGDKSLADLLAAAKQSKTGPMELCERIIEGEELPEGIKPGMKRNMAHFVGVVKKLRRAANEGASVADLINLTIEKTGYEEYLQHSQPNFDSRWENVKELISFSVSVAQDQMREATTDFDADEPDLKTLASSAAAEAIVEADKRKEEEANEKKIHGMFRRRSASEGSRTRSESVTVEEQVKPGKKRKGKAAPAAKKRTTRSMKAVVEEPIEIVDSDEEPKKEEVTEVQAVRSSDVINEANVEARYAKAPEVSKEVDVDAQSAKDSEVDEQQSEEVDKAKLTPLSYFLQASMLSTDVDADKLDEASRPKVTLITVHSAKGLEWPVVFVPSVEDGTFPFFKCQEPEEIAEERRLLYVAMTRAQAFLTLTHCLYRMARGEERAQYLSQFVVKSQKEDSELFSSDLPDVDLAVRRNLATMLGREAPTEEIAQFLIKKNIKTAPPLSMWDEPEPGEKNNRFARRDVTKATRAAEYWSSQHDEYALPGQPGHSQVQQPYQGFNSARAMARDPNQRMSKPYKGDPANRSPPKPVVKLQSKSQIDYEPMPFTFGTKDAEKKDQDLGSFANNNSSSLSAMKNLGLPGENEPLGSGSAKVNSIGNAGTNAQSGKPAKRLGMGRSAPKGAKK